MARRGGVGLEKKDPKVKKKRSRWLDEGSGRFRFMNGYFPGTASVERGSIHERWGGAGREAGGAQSKDKPRQPYTLLGKTLRDSKKKKKHSSHSGRGPTHHFVVKGGKGVQSVGGQKRVLKELGKDGYPIIFGAGSDKRRESAATTVQRLPNVGSSKMEKTKREKIRTRRGKKWR